MKKISSKDEALLPLILFGCVCGWFVLGLMFSGFLDFPSLIAEKKEVPPLLGYYMAGVCWVAGVYVLWMAVSISGRIVIVGDSVEKRALFGVDSFDLNQVTAVQFTHYNFGKQGLQIYCGESVVMCGEHLLGFTRLVSLLDSRLGVLSEIRTREIPERVIARIGIPFLVYGLLGTMAVFMFVPDLAQLIWTDMLPVSTFCLVIIFFMLLPLVFLYFLLRNGTKEFILNSDSITIKRYIGKDIIPINAKTKFLIKSARGIGITVSSGGPFGVVMCGLNTPQRLHMSGVELAVRLESLYSGKAKGNWLHLGDPPNLG